MVKDTNAKPGVRRGERVQLDINGGDLEKLKELVKNGRFSRVEVFRRGMRLLYEIEKNGFKLTTKDGEAVIIL
jgi:Arc/MetJ-type ribon-helix-helix transcriptional regulator